MKGSGYRTAPDVRLIGNGTPERGSGTEETRGRSINHPEYPLERVCAHPGEPFQLRFARDARELLKDREEVGLAPSRLGLVIRGENEDEIDAIIRILRDEYGAEIRVGPPTIRYHRGRTLEEPWMGLQVRCAAGDLERVKLDLIVRGASAIATELGATGGVIRACAPLAALIGYGAALEALTSGPARHAMWLSHYEPVQGPPPGGEAA